MRSDAAAPWTTAWPDALAFAAGLGVAWLFEWTAADLVWSLWLSSLVVGWATMLVRFLRPPLAIARGAWRDRVLVREAMAGKSIAAAVGVGSVMLGGGVFLLGFFTVHFGFFHFIHAQFLAMIFPLSEARTFGVGGIDAYAEIVRRYWIFLPAAFLAERAAFLPPEPETAPDTSVTAAAIAIRLANGRNGFEGMLAPYRNVVRMHLLIFFFVFAAFAALDNFAVYAVVSTVYFFPWRLLRRGRAPAPGEPAPAERTPAS